VGTELAAQTTAVEEALAAGDDVRARAEADALVAAVRAAIDRGDVPAPLRDELLAAAERLASLVPAPEPPAPAPAPPPADEDDAEDDAEDAEDAEEDEDDGGEDEPGKKDKGKGEGRGKGRG
jgi:hypothetical protein